MGGPINPQLPILSYALNHLNLTELVETVNALGRERHGSRFRVWTSHEFWETVFLLGGEVNTQEMCAKFHSHYSPRIIFIFLMQRELAEGVHLMFLCLFLYPSMAKKYVLNCTV